MTGIGLDPCSQYRSSCGFMVNLMEDWMRTTWVWCTSENILAMMRGMVWDTLLCASENNNEDDIEIVKWIFYIKIEKDKHNFSYGYLNPICFINFLHQSRLISNLLFLLYTYCVLRSFRKNIKIWSNKIKHFCMQRWYEGQNYKNKSWK